MHAYENNIKYDLLLTSKFILPYLLPQGSGNAVGLLFIVDVLLSRRCYPPDGRSAVALLDLVRHFPTVPTVAVCQVDKEAD